MQQPFPRRRARLINFDWFVDFKLNQLVIYDSFMQIAAMDKARLVAVVKNDEYKYGRRQMRLNIEDNLTVSFDLKFNL